MPAKMITRKDGSKSRRWLRDNIRAKAKKNKRTGAKPKKPTKDMLMQEKKIKMKYSPKKNLSRKK